MWSAERPTTERGRPVERASAAGRQIYLLEEQLRELELRLRERADGDAVRELELRAMRRELEVKHAYIATLESAQGGLHAQLSEVHAAHGATLGELQGAQARIAELGALVAAMQRRKSARAVHAFSQLMRLPGRVVRRFAHRGRP